MNRTTRQNWSGAAMHAHDPRHPVARHRSSVMPATCHGGRSHPLRHSGAGGPARRHAHGARRRRQERPAGRASFQDHLRHHGARACGCRDRMQAQYPQDMTIVLQHQFWDLTVTETGLRSRPVVRRHSRTRWRAVRGGDGVLRSGRPVRLPVRSRRGGAAAEAPAAAQTVDKSAAPAPALTAGERPEPLPAPRCRDAARARP